MSLGCVYPEISSSLSVFVLWLVRPGLFFIFFFFSNYQLFILAPLTNATPGLSTLWLFNWKVVWRLVEFDWPWSLTWPNKTFKRHIYSLTHYQTINFTLFQTERVCRWQFQIWRKWQKVIQTGKKKQWKKEKLLVTSNFSFSDSVFKRLFPRASKGVIVWEWVKGKNYTKMFWNTSINIEVLVWTDPDGRRAVHTPKWRLDDYVSYVSLVPSGLKKKKKKHYGKRRTFSCKARYSTLLDSDFFSEQTFACLMPCFQYRNVWYSAITTKKFTIITSVSNKLAHIWPQVEFVCLGFYAVSRLMTWWLRVRSPVEATFLSGVFSPLTSAEASVTNQA